MYKIYLDFTYYLEFPIVKRKVSRKTDLYVKLQKNFK